MRDASMKPPRLRGRPTLRPPALRWLVCCTEKQCIFFLRCQALALGSKPLRTRARNTRGEARQGTIMQYENTLGLAAMQLLVDRSL